MPRAPKSVEQQFTANWSKAVAWATSQGISSASYLPVYQMDLTRIQNGEYPMSVAERNLEILAAHNPNNVTPAPSDTPSSSNVMGNVVSDAGKIATGVIGIFTGSFEKQLWHSAQATFDGIMHPASLEAPTLGGTIGNWLDKTLLAYLPGAVDVGKFLTADPTLSGDAGFKALAADPLISILDLAGGDVLGGGLLGRAGAHGLLGAPGRAAAVRAAERGSLLQKLGQVKTPFGKAGVTMSGELLDRLPIKDAIQNMLAKAPGVGPAIGNLSEAYNLAGSMGANQYAWMLDGPIRAMSDLPEKDQLLVQKILDTRGHTEGDSVVKAMDDPTISPAVKDVLHQWLNGPLRFATEESLFSDELRPINTLDGRVGMYAPTSKSARGVFLAKAARDTAHRSAAEQIARLYPYVNRLEALDASLAASTSKFSQLLVGARRAVAEDEGLQGNVTQKLSGEPTKGIKRITAPTGPTKFRQTRGLSKSVQVRAVIGEGGLADDFVKAITARRPDPDQIEALATAMKHRLSKWGPKSVNAADSPALQALAGAVDAFEKWGKEYRRNANEIDRAIHGEIETTKALRNQHGEYRGLQVKQLRDRHAVERDNLREQGRVRQARLRADFSDRVARANEFATMMVTRIETEGDAAAANLKGSEVDRRIMPGVRGQIAQARHNLANSIAAARHDYLAKAKIAKLERDKAMLRLSKKQHEAMDALKKHIAAEKAGMGDLIREIVAYGKTIDRYHQSVMDHPSDEFRDVYQMLYEKHLLEHEASAEMVGVTSRHLADRAHVASARIVKIRSDPTVLAEYVTAVFRGKFGQPDMTPEVAIMARDAMREAADSAKEELKQLIASGLRVQYIPTAVSFDERLGKDSMAPVVGHGIPKPDMAKAKVWDMTPAKTDFALGINKAVVQALQRDAIIELTEHYLKPMTLTQAQVNNFIQEVFRPEERTTGGNIAHEFQNITAKDIGLTAVDTKAMFGFRLPRWGTDEVYLPTPIVDALKRLNHERTSALARVSAKSTKLFRYSILGLSPRYDAHIIFGGTMMLALRSTPYAVTMIGDAARALRDGTLPEGLSRHAVEEGFEESAMRLWQTQGGRDLHTLAVNEHIEQVQGIARVAAKPIHVLRAAADINFRFTRYVRDLQAAVAYLDGAAKAERRLARIKVEDPVTGKTLTLSPDRAMKEGMHHVQEVFGNLNRMSPFERSVAQSVMPFYGWQRHILGYVMSFPHDHPWRAMVLSQLAGNASNDVPLAYPIRIQLLYLLGSPDANGNVNAVDVRSLDPFRDVANYATWTGFFESLNPALTAPLAMAFGPGAVFGSTTLYPNVTYNNFYGIETSGSQGNLLTGLTQWIPQIGAAGSALAAVSGVRSMWNTNRSAAIKTMLESLNIPFVTPPVNLKQIAARDEAARYRVAKQDAYNAFSSGDFSGLTGYKTVPNPLNPAYEITPKALEALYAQAQAAAPGVAPIESLLPPPTPYGW